jgi:hypothetical protein
MFKVPSLNTSLLHEGGAQKGAFLLRHGRYLHILTSRMKALKVSMQLLQTGQAQGVVHTCLRIVQERPFFGVFAVFVGRQRKAAKTGARSVLEYIALWAGSTEKGVDKARTEGTDACASST